MALMQQVQGDEKAKSSPVIKRQVTLSTLSAQKVMKRSFEKLSESLFQISVILRAVGEREHIDKAEELIAEHFDGAATDIEKKLEQMQALAEQNGVKSSADYTNQVTFEVEINTPHIARFVGLVLELDKLVCVIDALWLHACLDDRQVSNARYEWSRRLINVAGRIIGMARRVRNEAYNEGRKELVDSVAGAAPSDEDMDEELREASLADEKPKSTNSKSKPAGQEQDEAKVA